MPRLAILGIDLAKSVFQLHGVDAGGGIAVQKKLHRPELMMWLADREPCLVAMEACASAHYWAGCIRELGHDVRLIHPIYVKPYVKREKNDRNDAAAICEAASRPTMRFVAVKSPDQRAVQIMHRSRELLIKQRVELGNALRAHCAEFGYVFPQGQPGLRALRQRLGAPEDDLPPLMKDVLLVLAGQQNDVEGRSAVLKTRLLAWHRAHADSRRLTTIPGIGVLTATAIIAAVGDGRSFRSGREFAAWVGLTPREYSSGGKIWQGGISKRGNPQLRRLLVTGATSLTRGERWKNAPGGAWFGELLKRKPHRAATVALANKMARIAWAVLTHGEDYRPAPVPATDEAACPVSVSLPKSDAVSQRSRPRVRRSEKAGTDAATSIA